jgi:hypothetical protein
VLKTRCVAGVETLILRGEPRPGTFGIPVAWTDLAPPSLYGDDEQNASLLEYRCLLALTGIVARLNDGTLETVVKKSEKGC